MVEAGRLNVGMVGPGLKVAARTVNGPSSYSAGGFNVEFPELSTIVHAIVQLRNNPGNKLVQVNVTDNTVNIKIFTISADTTTGAISATEDADGTDESGLVFDVIAIGY